MDELGAKEKEWGQTKIGVARRKNQERIVGGEEGDAGEK